MGLPVAGAAIFETCVVIHFLHAEFQPAIGILWNWSLKIRNEMPPFSFEYELGWTAFLASGTPQKWISRRKKLKNDLEFHQTGHWKVKMGCPLPFENESGWSAFLASRTLQKWISMGKRLKNDSRSGSWLSACKQDIILHNLKFGNTTYWLLHFYLTEAWWEIYIGSLNFYSVVVQASWTFSSWYFTSVLPKKKDKKYGSLLFEQASYNYFYFNRRL